MESTSLCSIELYLGILMRYVKSSSEYLGKGGDGINFDIAYYKPRDALGNWLNDIIDEIEQITIFKYDGVRHWGANHSIPFEDVTNKFEDGENY